MNREMQEDQFLITAPATPEPRFTRQSIREHLSDSDWLRAQGVARAEIPDGLVRVRPTSLLSIRRGVGQCALYFQREFGYDFQQYLADEQPHPQDCVWVWVHDTRCYPNPRRMIGAGAFRWRQWKNHSPGHGLSWVWFHPFFRRQGHLSRAWPLFRKLFGDFLVEAPLSAAMYAFLRKRGECPVCASTRTCKSCAAGVPL